MEVRRAAGCGGNFAPGIFENPTDEAARGFVVSTVAEHTDAEEAEVLKKSIPLVAQWTPRAEEVAFDHAALLEHECRLGLHIGVIGGQIIGKKRAVLENRINRLAKKTRLATKPTHCLAVAGFVIADDGIRLSCHGRDAMRSAGCREGNCHWLCVWFAKLWTNPKILPCLRRVRLGRGRNQTRPVFKPRCRKSGNLLGPQGG